MRKLKTLGLLAALTTLSVAQNPMDFLSPEIKRVGMKLACLCGSCRNTVGDCAMIACGYSFPARQKIKRLQSMGSSDASVVGNFIKTEGLKTLAEPQTSGFGLIGWIMPGLVIVLGLMGIAVYWKRFRNPSIKVSSKVDAATISQYDSQAADELEKLEK